MENKRNAKIFLILMLFLCAVAWYTFSKGEDEAESYEVLMEKAERYEANEVYLKAFDAYEAAYAKQPGYEVAMKIAKLAQEVQQLKSMVKYCEAAIGHKPEEAEPYAMLMSYYTRTASYATAFEVYGRAGNVKDREEIEALYDVIHGGYIVRYTNVEKFRGWYLDNAAVSVAGMYGIVNASLDVVMEIQYEDIGMYNAICNLAPVCEDGKWLYVASGGVKNSLGIGYEEFGNFGNGLAPVKVKGGSTYIDVEGNYYDVEKKTWISFDEVQENGFPTAGYEDATGFSYQVAAVKKNGKWALINSSMALLTDFMFEDVIINEYGFCSNAGLVIAKEGGQYYFYNLEGVKVGGTGFEDVKPFLCDEYVAICQSGKWGFADKQGKVVIEPQFDDAISFQGGFAPVKLNDLWGFVDASGEIVCDPIFAWMSGFSSKGNAFVQYPNTTVLKRIQLYDHID